LYEKRKETIERLFGTAKEFYGLRYTNMIGKARMQMKVGLTFACMNLKKLARILWKKNGKSPSFSSILASILDFLDFFSLPLNFQQKRASRLIP
jgi:hypothetical protein